MIAIKSSQRNLVERVFSVDAHVKTKFTQNHNTKPMPGSKTTVQLGPQYVLTASPKINTQEKIKSFPHSL